MKILHDIEHYGGEKSVVTLGKFDGMHLGHSMLFQQMKMQEKNDLSSVVVTFDKSPLALLTENSTEYILSRDEKYRVYEKKQPDYLLEIPLTKNFLALEPEEFVKRYLVDGLNAKVIIVGKDYHFGKGRAGNPRLLQELAEKYGFEVMILDKLCYKGEEVSSTRIREAIHEGKLSEANDMLGYPYFLMEKVIRGRQLGRTIGVPTINMQVPDGKVLPPFGVYAVNVVIDGESYKGMANLGVKPTVGEHNPINLETYILNYEGDLYDKICVIEFFEYVRPEKKFESIEQLKLQIEKDIQYIVVR